MNIFSEYAAVRQLLSAKQPIVFYAENRYYYQYFEQLIADLLNQNVSSMVYITSDKSDPLLSLAPVGLQVFYVHWWLAFLFNQLKANVVVMTMTDLGNYAFKRSKSVGNYVYLFHAAVSTHQQYSQKAFYHYDTIFATGEYQTTEIRAAEKLYGLPVKSIVHYGYPITDTLKEKAITPGLEKQKEKPVILVAPSWFKDCIFDTCLEELVEELSLFACTISIRPHPEYIKRKKKKFDQLKQWAGSFPSVSFDYSADVMQSLLNADILITDRSGIALEYSLGIGKPVLFIDTPLKIMNPNWQELKIEPFENAVRSKIGVSILPAEINKIAEKIEHLNALKNTFRQEAASLKNNHLYNSPASRKAGLEFVISKL